MAEQTAFDKTQLRAVFKALKNMDEQAVDEAKRQSGALAEYARKEVIAAASGLQSRAVASRVAEGSKVKKSSRIGEVTYGFAAQKFSGGATTKVLWGASEFGSNKFKQFPVWSGPNPSGGPGSKGYFIYPTLRRIQPYIISEWTKSFDKILKEWT